MDPSDQSIAICTEKIIMNKASIRIPRKLQFPLLVATFPTLAMLLFWSQLTFAQEPNQQVFRSPEEASGALFAAVQKADNRALLEILWRGGEGPNLFRRSC